MSSVWERQLPTIGILILNDAMSQSHAQGAYEELWSCICSLCQHFVSGARSCYKALQEIVVKKHEFVEVWEI